MCIYLLNHTIATMYLDGVSSYKRGTKQHHKRQEKEVVGKSMDKLNKKQNESKLKNL